MSLKKLSTISIILILLSLPAFADNHGESHSITEKQTAGQPSSPDQNSENEHGFEALDHIKSGEKHGDSHGEPNAVAMIAHHLNDGLVLPIQLDINTFQFFVGDEIQGSTCEAAANGYGKCLDLSVTKRVVMIWIVAFLLLLIFIPAAAKIKKCAITKPSRFTGIVEVFVDFIRKDIVQPSMGHHAKNYEPYLITVFFFILFCNLIGLFPPFGELFDIASGSHLGVNFWPAITATGDSNTNAVLAAFTLIAIFIAGYANQGPLFFPFMLVPKGINWVLWPLMLPIEFFGFFVKPAVLAIRLLANMTAGHMIIIVLLSFIIVAKTWVISLVSVPGAAVIYFLELFVAFLQAYIFTFLSALFIGSVQHRH